MHAFTAFRGWGDDPKWIIYLIEKIFVFIFAQYVSTKIANIKLKECEWCEWTVYLQWWASNTFKEVNMQENVYTGFWFKLIGITWGAWGDFGYNLKSLKVGD